MKASSVRDARPAICRPCIPEAVEGGGGGVSIPGHNYLELRFTSNSTQLCLLHVPVNRGTKEKGLAGEHFIDTVIQNVT